MDSCSDCKPGSFLLAFVTVCIAAGAALAPEHAKAERAQYKWTDDKGRVHYSDRPPRVEPRQAPVVVSTARSDAGGHSGLPWALRSATTRYPVVLYTAADCEPCDTARAHLARRGIPYTEKRVESAADLEAFKTLGFPSSMFPSVSIGRDKLTGFEAGGWDRTLDATGYPKASMLPASHALRTLEPMRAAPASASASGSEPAAGLSGAEAASGEPAATGTDASATAANAGSLFPRSSLRTGPNPIRF